MLPDLVLINGQIVTCDAAFSMASSIAIKGDRIIAVGDDSLASMADDSSRVIDLGGRMVVPGFVDAYSHVMSSGLDLLPSGGKINISKQQSVADIVATVSARAAQTPDGQWIATSCMYRGGLAEGRWPNRHDLDQAAPNHPAYIMQGGRPIIANSRALELAGIGQDTPDPQDPAGRIVRGPDGLPTGQLIAGAADMARRRWAASMGIPPEEWDFMLCGDKELIAALEAQQKVFHACGITATRDVATMRREVGAFVLARKQGRLKLRTQLMVIIPERYMRTDADYAAVFDSYFQPWETGDSLLSIGGVAIDYSLDGWKMIDKAQLLRLVQESNRRGWTLAVTPGVGGEGEVDDVLDALESANEDRPIASRRFPMMHPMGLRRADQRDRAKRLGLTLNPNPLLNYFAAERSVKMFEAVAASGLLQSNARNGFEQAAEMWGLSTRDWLDDGFVVSAGSNTPAAVYDINHPLTGLYALVTGDTRVGVLLQNQGVSHQQALQIYTCNGAAALGLVHELGSLEPGKLADFSVFDTDLLNCSASRLLKARATATYFGGDLVYER